MNKNINFDQLKIFNELESFKNYFYVDNNIGDSMYYKTNAI